MKKLKVILDPHGRKLGNLFTDKDLARLRESAEIIWGRDEPMPDGKIEETWGEAEAIITGRWRYGDIDRFPEIRAILEVSGGFPSSDSLDYAKCFARSIRVLSCAPAFGPAVAEMGLGLALACSRQIAYIDNAFRAGDARRPNWSHTEFRTEIGETFTLYGKQVGFIGYGGLARSLKPLLEPFKCPIQVYDPWLADAYLRTQGVAPADLDTVLATSRIIFALAIPSSSNRAMLTREKLSLVRPDAVFVLLSRSHVVDFEAMTEMLVQGRFRAGIDVFPEEPLPEDHPIRNTKFAVLSSHRAGAISDALLNIGRMVTNDIEAIARGLVPQEMQAAQPEFIRMRDQP